MVNHSHPSLNPNLADRFGNIGERFLPVVTKLPPLKVGSRPQVCIYEQHLWLWDGTSWGIITGALSAHDHTATDGSGILTKDEHDDYSQYLQIGMPGAPDSNHVLVYAKLDGGVAKLYYRTSAGEVGPLASSSGSHNPVTLDGSYDYIQIDGAQKITRYQIDLATDVTGVLVDGNIPAGITRDTEHGDFTPQGHSGLIEHADISPAEGFVRKTGAGTYTAIKSNLSSAADPTVNDDQGDGYSEGSLWVNTTTNKVFFCADPTVAAAVWKEVGLDEKVKVSSNDTIAKYLIEKVVGEASSPLHTFSEVNDGGDEDLRVTGVFADASQSGHVSASPQTFGGLKTFNGGAYIDALFALKKDTATIDANDEIALPSHPYVYLTCSGASDSLDGIVGGVEGHVLFLRPAAGKDITLVHNGTVTTGKKLMINGEANYVMNEDHDFAIAIYDDTALVWNVIVPGGGGHTIEDEGNPLTTRANLDIRGNFIRASDSAPDTRIETSAQFYDAVVDNASPLADQTGTAVYSTIQAAVDAGHMSIMVRSAGDTSAISITSGKTVQRISGKAPFITGARVNVDFACSKDDVTIEYLFFTQKLTISGARDIVFACVFFKWDDSSVGRMEVTGARCQIVSCMFNVTGDATYPYPLDVGADADEIFILATRWLGCGGTNCIRVANGCNGGAIIGCAFQDNTALTGHILSLGTSSTGLVSWQVNGCAFKRFDTGGIQLYSLGIGNGNINISGNAFNGVTKLAATAQTAINIAYGAGISVSGNSFIHCYRGIYQGVATVVTGIGRAYTGNAFNDVDYALQIVAGGSLGTCVFASNVANATTVDCAAASNVAIVGNILYSSSVIGSSVTSGTVIIRGNKGIDDLGSYVVQTDAVVDLGTDAKRFKGGYFSDYVLIGNVASLPTASATYRGKFILVLGGSGVTDTLYMCLKSAADTYSWVALHTGG